MNFFGQRVTVGTLVADPIREENAVTALREDRLPSEHADGLSDSEVREVRAEDPALTAETNQRLTTELREVLGTDRVEVPADRPHTAHGERPERHGTNARVEVDRLQVIRMSAIALTFGGIIALITRNWWILPLAAGVFGLATLSVSLTIIRMTTVSDRPSPSVAAAMAEEGIRNPDAYFSRMIDEFRAEPEHGAAEVLAPGFNERRAPSDTATAAAGAEQSSAMTPTSQRSHASGERGAPDALVWAAVVILFVLSIVLPPWIGGGWMWLLTAVMVPLLLSWAVTQRTMVTRRNQLPGGVQGRELIIAIAVCTAITVAAFVAVVALAFSH